jgi:hypothetical protein
MCCQVGLLALASASQSVLQLPSQLLLASVVVESELQSMSVLVLVQVLL